jgi:hypothetical protein
MQPINYSFCISLENYLNDFISLWN